MIQLYNGQMDQKNKLRTLKQEHTVSSLKNNGLMTANSTATEAAAAEEELVKSQIARFRRILGKENQVSDAKLEAFVRDMLLTKGQSNPYNCRDYYEEEIVF